MWKQWSFKDFYTRNLTQTPDINTCTGQMIHFNI